MSVKLEKRHHFNKKDAIVIKIKCSDVFFIFKLELDDSSFLL